MPHIIVKLAAGRSEQTKTKLTEALAQAAVETLDIDPATVSVAIEEVKPSTWVEAVYKPDILGQMDRIYKKPGYDPL